MALHPADRRPQPPVPGAPHPWPGRSAAPGGARLDDGPSRRRARTWRGLPRSGSLASGAAGTPGTTPLAERISQPDEADAERSSGEGTTEADDDVVHLVRPERGIIDGLLIEQRV